MQPRACAADNFASPWAEKSRSPPVGFFCNGAAERNDTLKPRIDLAQGATRQVAFSGLRVFSPLSHRTDGPASEARKVDTEGDCAGRPIKHRQRACRRNSEQTVQRTVCEHLRRRGAHGVLWWHTPNGGRRSPVEAAIFSGFGVRAGVSDLILLRDGRVFALELKTERGRPTAAQLQFISEFRAAGGEASIANGLDQALHTLETWKLLRGRAA